MSNGAPLVLIQDAQKGVLISCDEDGVWAVKLTLGEASAEGVGGGGAGEGLLPVLLSVAEMLIDDHPELARLRTLHVGEYEKAAGG